MERKLGHQWAIFDGGTLFCITEYPTRTETKRDTIGNFCNANYRHTGRWATWDELKRRGFSCRKITIKEGWE